jgi:hypothetical protein
MVDEGSENLPLGTGLLSWISVYCYGRMPETECLVCGRKTTNYVDVGHSKDEKPQYVPLCCLECERKYYEELIVIKANEK